MPEANGGAVVVKVKADTRSASRSLKGLQRTVSDPSAAAGAKQFDKLAKAFEKTAKESAKTRKLVDQLARSNVSANRAVANLSTQLGKAANGNKELSATAKQAKAAVDQQANSVRKLADQSSGIGGKIASIFKGGSGAAQAAKGFIAAQVALIGFRGAFNFLKNDVVGAASAFQETTNVIQAGFGDAAQETEEWAQTTANFVGRSTQQLREFAGTLQSVLPGLIGNREVAGELSKVFSELAIDLGSFFNVADNQALNAIRSGLTGESEPLKRFGVILNEATVASKGLELGLGGVNGKLDEQEKVVARAAVILEKTADAQGDARRTADGYANSAKALQGRIKDAAISVGLLLLPALAKASDFLAGATQTVVQFARFTSLSLQASFAIIGEFASNIVDSVAGTFAEIKISALESIQSIQDFFGVEIVGGIPEALENAKNASKSFAEDIRKTGEVTDSVFAGITSDIEDVFNVTGASLLANFKIEELIEKFKATKGSAQEVSDEVLELAERFKEIRDASRFEASVAGLDDAEQQSARINKAFADNVAEATELATKLGLTNGELEEIVANQEKIRDAKLKVISDKEAKKLNDAKKSFEDLADSISRENLRLNLEGDAERKIEEINFQAEALTRQAKELQIKGEVDRAELDRTLQDIQTQKDLKIKAVLDRQDLDRKLQSQDRVLDIAGALGFDGIVTAFRGAREESTGVIDSFKVLETVTTGAAIAGITAFTGAVFSTITNISSVQNALGELSTTINASLQQALEPVGDALAPILNQVAVAVSALAPVFTSIGDVISAVLEPLESLFVAVSDLADGVGAVLSPILDGLAEVLRPIVQLVGNVLSPVVNAVGKTFKALGDALKPVIDIVTGVLSPILDALGRTLGLLVNALIEPIIDALEPALEALGAALEPLTPIFEQFGQILADISEAFAPLLALVIEFSPAMTKMKVILGLVTTALEILRPALEALAGIAESIGNVFGGITDSAKSFGQSVADVGRSIADGVTGLFSGRSPGDVRRDRERQSAEEQRAQRAREARQRELVRQQGLAQSRFDDLQSRGTRLNVDASDGFNSRERKLLEEEYAKLAKASERARELGIDPAGKSSRELATAIKDEEAARRDEARQREADARQRRREREERANVRASRGFDDVIQDTRNFLADEILGSFASGQLGNAGASGSFIGGFLDSLGIASSRIQEIFGDGSLSDIDFSGLFSELLGVDQSADGIDQEIRGQLADVLRSFDAFDDAEIGQLVRRFSEQLEGATDAEKEAFLEKLALEEEQIEEIKKQLEEQGKNSDTLSSINKSLSNVPQGFKIASARLRAITAEDFLPDAGEPDDPLVESANALDGAALSLSHAASLLAQSLAGGLATVPSAPSVPGRVPRSVSRGAQRFSSGGGLTVSGVTVLANDPREFMEKLEKESALRRAISNGNPYSTGLTNSGNN